MSERLKNRYALITGGHVSLGFAIAKRFLSEGARVAVVGRSPERLEVARQKLAPLGEVHAVVQDITAPGGPAQAVAEAERLGGSCPNVLVNCAGVFLWKAMLEVTPEEWARTLDTQLTAPFLMTQALARRLVEQGRAAGASVINIGSVHGPVGDANVVHQCTAKEGVLGLTRASAEALRVHGIRVNAIVPGAISPETPDRISETLEGKITQADVAAVAVMLASPESGGITGAAIEAYGSSRPVIGT